MGDTRHLSTTMPPNSTHVLQTSLLPCSYLLVCVLSNITKFIILNCFPGKEMVMPGDDTELTLTMKSDIPIEVNQRFTLREGHKTVGTGVVTQIIQ